jgi:hypothetical protein
LQLLPVQDRKPLAMLIGEITLAVGDRSPPRLLRRQSSRAGLQSPLARRPVVVRKLKGAVASDEIAA